MIFHSLFEYSYLWLPIIGFVIGFCASLIGGGGGFFILPVLILFYQVPAQVAVATSLAATIPICMAGTFSHYRQNNIDKKIGLIFIITGVAGALIGAYLTSIITSDHLKIAFGIYCLFLASQMFYNILKNKGKRRKTHEDMSNRQKKSRGSSFGLLAGIITGTFGTSGTAPVLAGLFSLNMPLKLIAGTSIVVVSVNTIAALGAHFMVGRIDLTLVYFLTIGTFLGALIGPKKMAKVKLESAEGHARFWFAVIMVIFGVVMIFS